MDLLVEINAFRQLLTSSQKIVILLPETASHDAIAAGLSLFLSLTALNKNVTIGFPKQPIVAWSQLVGIDRLTQKIGNKNLVISLDYKENAIEKVSYNIEGSKFNLVVELSETAPKYSADNVQFNYKGISADLFITLETAEKEALGVTFNENKELFEQKPIVVIDNRTVNTQYGKVNFVRPTATISEIVAHIIKQMELPVDIDIASNLYAGIVVGSNNFDQNAVTPSTFEAAAYVLQSGARKPQRTITSQEETPRQEFAFTKNLESPVAPPDWFKPKIYKGSTLL